MTKTVKSRFVLKGDNQLNRSFKQAKQQMAALGRQAALAGAAAAAGAILIVKKNAEAIDTLAKTSDALRTSTEDLQTLRAMSELAGVSSEKLDDKLSKMQKNLGLIARQGGTLAEALHDMGLSVEEVLSLGAGEQFEVIANALATVENQTLRASIASDLFGRDSNKLLKLTDQLAKDGLEPMREELEAMGFLISRSDAAGVEQMNDAMTMAGKVVTGLGQKFTIALAPAIQAVAEAFIDSAKESGGFSDEVDGSSDFVVDALGTIADAVSIIGRAFKITANVSIIAFEMIKSGALDLADSIVNGPNRAVNKLLDLANLLPQVIIPFRFGDITDSLKNDVDLSIAIIDSAVDAINEALMAPMPSEGLKDRVRAIREELEKFQQTASEPTGPPVIDLLALTQAERALISLQAKVDQFGMTADQKALIKIIDLKATDAQIAQAEILLAKLRELKDLDLANLAAAADKLALEKEYGSLIKSTRTEVEKHAAQLHRVNLLFEAGVIPSTEEYEAILIRINDQFVKAGEKVGELDQFTLQAARNMETHMADFFFDPFDKGMQGLLDGFIDVVRRMVAEAAAAELANTLFGGMGSASGGGGGGGGLFSSLFGAFAGAASSSGGGGGGSSFAGGLGGSFGSMDRGGRGQPGKGYVINPKAAPEIFWPDSSGTFIPNAKMSTQTTDNSVVNIILPANMPRQTAMQLHDSSQMAQRQIRNRNI